LIRHKPGTFVVYDAIGLDIEQNYTASLGIMKDRLFLVSSMLAHQPTNTIPILASANSSLVTQVDILYSWQPDPVGLLAFNTRPKIIKSFQAVYNKNCEVRVQVAPAFVAPLAIFLGTLHQVVWRMDNFGEFEHLRGSNALVAADRSTERNFRLTASWTVRLTAIIGPWFLANGKDVSYTHQRGIVTPLPRVQCISTR
jgi:hypothetical protein